MSGHSAEKDALHSIWREAAEKRIEAGIDWPRIVLDLFRELDALRPAPGCICPAVAIHRIGCPVVTSPNACPACGVELDPTGFCGWCDWGPEGSGTTTPAEEGQADA